jgi:hypothetical protein
VVPACLRFAGHDSRVRAPQICRVAPGCSDCEFDSLLHRQVADISPS